MIETCRMYLRPWRDEDAPALYRYASDPRVGYCGLAGAYRCGKQPGDHPRCVLSEPETYAVVLKQSGEPVGARALCCPVTEICPWSRGGRDRLLDRRALLGTRPDPGGGGGTAEAMLHGAGLPEGLVRQF